MAGPVFQDIKNDIAAKCSGVIMIAEIRNKAASVKTVQSFCCADPDKIAAVLNHTIYAAVAEALAGGIDGKMIRIVLCKAKKTNAL